MTALDDYPADVEYVKAPGQWRRQGDNGAPRVSDPDGVAVKSGARAGQVVMRTYSRPSSFGKQVENQYNLVRWQQRQGVIGMALDPTLVAEMVALNAVDECDTQVWRKAVDGIYTKAARTAGAMVGAERGTHGHLLTEDHDLDLSIVTRLERGEDLGLSPALQRAVVDAWHRLTDEWFEVLVVEAACVYDGWRVAGTLDRIVRLRKDLPFPDLGVVIPAGTILVLDIKTGGAKVDRAGYPIYWSSYAVQVAGYALSRPYDVDLERRGEWAWPVSAEHAVIAHIDIAGALDTDVVTAQLVYVDVDAGRQAGDLVVACKAWQRRRDVFSTTGHHLVAVTIETETPCPTPSPSDDSTTGPQSPAIDGGAETSTATADTTSNSTKPNPAPTETATSTSSDTATAPPSPTPSTLPSPEAASRSHHPTTTTTTPAAAARTDLQARARQLIDAGHGARLSIAWPAGVPGFKTDHPHTDDELAGIGRAVDVVWREVMPFDDDDMTLATPAPWLAAQPEPYVVMLGNTAVDTPTDEGGDLIPADVDAIRSAVAELDVADQFRIEAIVAQATTAGRSISLRQQASVRRFEIARALIECCRAGLSDDDIGDLCACVQDQPWARTTPLGAVVGALTLEQATALADMAAAAAEQPTTAQELTS